MYLMYVDESGDIGTKGSNSNYFVLSGLIIHELRWIEVLEELVNFRKHLKSSKSLNVREEIHASHFITKPGHLKSIPRNDRLDILKQTIDWISLQDGLNIITVVCNKTNQKAENGDLFELAWKTLIQRFENTIENHNFKGPRNPDERGLILPDNTDGHKLQTLIRKMRKFNPVPSKYSGYRNLRLKHIIEDPCLRNSEHSYFIQLVDVISYF
ncbi:MAG: DUF3800 domain-containing protein, partial [Candidatus Caenarcaniphilales bacterium]|nr:DUF3800 domain-containing protein [Candidatus Caenarcaniphilales bacterium]